jgi:1-aminocyclopropane-1-carboxylate deaminase/D-cysteine desulfhydrase-like pyridoxal-dependent ACC family enzyme
MIKNNTPVEKYKIDNKTVWVKREDLCTEFPAPPFSKVRGLYPHMKALQANGITTVGYIETPISMAGWGITWVAKELGMKVVIYEPQYISETPEIFEKHKRMWKYFGAEILKIPAGMTKVNFNVYKKEFLENYKNSVMLPLGIPCKETIEETALEFNRTILEYGFFDNVIVCVGSGTICAGIIKLNYHLIRQTIGILSRTGNIQHKKESILRKADLCVGKLFEDFYSLTIKDPGWEYTQRSNVECPFPCHPYYDLKAWEWLVKNINKLSGRVLFWNIGNDRISEL